MKCQTCGAEFTGHKRKYCEPKCRPSYQERKDVGLERCQVCAKPLPLAKKAGHPKRNCSKECRERNRLNNLQNARTSYYRSCEICFKDFETKKHWQKTCSKQCSQIRAAKYAAEKQRQQIAQRPDFKSVTCDWCKDEIQVRSNFAGVVKYHEHCRKPARQAQYRIKSIRRQGVTNGNRISHDEVARRDNYICYLCNESVDMTLPRTSRYGATLDHVVPLKLGGKDELDNVRIAHWICNIRKSDMTLEEYRAKSR